MSDDTLIQVTRHDDVTVIYPGTAINERGLILDFTDQLIQFIEQEKPQKLQINFEHVQFFSSEAFNALIRAQHRVKASNGKMNLCGLSKDLRKLFKLCGLDGAVFQIFDSCREATASLNE